MTKSAREEMQKTENVVVWSVELPQQIICQRVVVVANILASESRCNMKEFIDKLIERLEELKELHAELIKDGLEEDYHSGCEGMCVDIIEIVNQLAEEYNKKQEHEVWLNGCDDDTIFTMEMTNNEYEFIKRVSELANETSTYYCMPRLYLDKGVGYTPPYTEGE